MAADRHDPPPDGPEILGSPMWLEAHDGVLTLRQRLRLTKSIAGQLPTFVAHRFRATLWRRRPSKGQIELALNKCPDSELAQQAIEECKDTLSPAMVNHSFRAWAFGTALAQLDDEKLDPELFFVAAMLHDIGLACPTYSACFTRTGVRKATELGDRCERDLDEVAIIASAISHHITPGLDPAVGGIHGLYMQQGSVLDLGGLRAIHLPVDFVAAACETWPTLGVNREGGARWRAESAMVKHGRAHHLKRWGCFVLAAWLTPVPP